MREDTILRKMRGRDPAGLEALMDRYIAYVSAVAWNILRSTMAKEDAEEVVSDVFLAAWEQADDLRPGYVKAWLGAVARNKAKNKLRELGRDLPLEEDFLELEDGEGIEESLNRREEGRLVRRAVDHLPDPDREIFLRHYFYAQSVREISDLMALNESTVKTKLRRGRLRLKTMLMRWGVQ